MSLFTLAIHGGAGTILRQDMTAEKELAYRRALEEALEAGYRLLEKGGTALAAVISITGIRTLRCALGGFHTLLTLVDNVR